MPKTTMAGKTGLAKPKPVKLNGLSLGSPAIQLARKRSLDRRLGRGRHDLIWELPTWATSMEIRFANPAVDRLLKPFGKGGKVLRASAHADPELAAPPRRHLKLRYVIELKCPLGTVTIDPMVDIQP